MPSDRQFRKKAVLKLARKTEQYYNCNPEVGFPALWWMHVDQAIQELGLQKTDVDYGWLVSLGAER